MRSLLFILFLLIGRGVFATDYYFAASGNDNTGNGTQASPYQTLTKASTLTVAGNRVLFNRGDSFYGTLTIAGSGTAATPIFIGAYGTGAKPIITGLTTLTGWTSYAGNSNIKQMTIGVGNVEVVTVNGVPTGRGRWPNTGFYNYTLVSDQSAISDPTHLNSATTNWTGAEIVMRKTAWTLSRDSITSHSGSTLNFVAGSNWENMQSNFGYFIQNSLLTLDQLGEWYIKDNIMYMYFGANTPSNYTVKAATKEKVISMDTRNYITFDNLQIEGADSLGVYIQNSGNIVLQNSDLNLMGKIGVYTGYLTHDVKILNCTVNNSYCNALFINGSGTNTIQNSVVKNTGMIMGTGAKGAGSGDFDWNGDGVVILTPNVMFSDNQIDSSGHIGVRIGSTNDTIYHNLVTNSAMVRNDASAIYAWSSGAMTGSLIKDNIVENVLGNTSGMQSGHEFVGVHGIYLDYVSDVKITGNTVANVEEYGILINGSQNIEIHDNKTYNSRNFELQINERTGNLATNNNVTRNQFFSKNASNASLANINSASFLFYSDVNSTLPNFGTMDSNYYARPIDNGQLFLVYKNGSWANYTLAQWKTASGKDAHSFGTPKTITTTADLRFEYNASLTPKVVSLDAKYMDVTGAQYNSGSITLQPYTSTVLIKNGALTNTDPPGIYVSSSDGNDANDGANSLTPIKTLSKLNSLTLAAGTHVYLKRNDSFTGTIVVNQSGTSSNPIVIDAYGTGAKPVVTGFANITSWYTPTSDLNLWESLNTIGSLADLNLVSINNVNTPMGRYPNTGWLTYQSHNANLSITSSSLTGTPNWTGAQVVLKKEKWDSHVGKITAQSGGTISYTDNGIDVPQNGYGFFIQDDNKTLDLQNEWYYNDTTKKLRIYSSVSPTNVKVPTLDSVMVINGNYVTVQNIEFTGTNNSAVKVVNGDNITFDSCVVSYAGDVGIILTGSTGSVVKNSYVHHTNGNAIRSDNNTTIQYCTVENASMIYGMVRTYNFGAITTSSGGLVQYNKIDSVGYNGIMLNGRTNSTVDKNFVNHACMLYDDGAAIYTSLSGTNTTITNNIVTNTKGGGGGNPDTDVMAFGIYLDSYTTGTTVSYNTAANNGGAGLFVSNADNNVLTYNTLYNNSIGSGFSAQSELQIQHICCNVVTANTVSNNTYFVANPAKYAIFVYSITDDVPSWFTAMDNNKFFSNATNVVSTQINAAFSNKTLPQWRTYTGKEANSTITQQGDSTVRFEYNATNVSKTVSLDAKYIGTSGTTYDAGSIILAPYTSAILRRNGDLANVPDQTGGKVYHYKGRKIILNKQ
jgi:parallel beta-helix repeat protein